MIKLIQFAPAFGLPNASPFCMKAETYLRMAGLPFETVNSGDVLKAPKRKLPYLDDDGTVVADSHLIAEYLVAKYGDRLDACLSAHDRALTTAFERLLEENLYWTAVHTRWTTDDAWEKTRAAFFGTMPAPLRWIVPSLARRGMLREMHGHGMGRHTPDEIQAIGCRDITARWPTCWVTSPTCSALSPTRWTPPPMPSSPISFGRLSTRRSSSMPRRGRRWKPTASA